MTRWTLRGRDVLQRRSFSIVLVLVGVALLGGWLAYGGYVDPGTHQEQRVVSSLETTQSFDHAATVVNDSTLFSEGEVARDRDVYYASHMPELDGTYAFAYESSGDGTLDVRSRATLVARSVGERDETEVTYWEFTRPLGERNVSDLRPGERADLSTSVDVEAIGRRIEGIRNELETSGGEVELAVRVETDYAGTVEGRPVDRRVDDELAIDYRGGEYHVTGDEPTTDAHNETAMVTVANPPGVLGRFGGPLLLAIGCLGTVALVAVRHAGALAVTDHDRERLAYADDRAAYDEWLTTVSLPASVYDGPAARASTLGDLVDLAIDSECAAIYDPARERYVVFAHGTRFEYRPPGPEPADDSLADVLDDGTGDDHVGDDAVAASPDGTDPTSDSESDPVADEPLADGGGGD